MLPLSLGWSFWIHLFVLYPKTVGAVVLLCGLCGVPMNQAGLGTSTQSVGRTVLCTVVEGPPVFCAREAPEEMEAKRPRR